MSANETKHAGHLVLIDGSGFIFRAFHGLPPMTRPDGTPVDVVEYGQAVEPCVERSRADQSFTRSPDGGAHWVPHLEANPDVAQSPGLRVDGSPF